MAGAVSKDKYSTQTIQNFGFDEKYKTPIRLVYAYDEDNDRLIPIRVDTNGDLYALPLPSGASTSDNQTNGSQQAKIKETVPTDGTKVNASIALTYTSGNLTKIEKTIGSTVYEKTLTYDVDGNLETVSVWSEV